MYPTIGGGSPSRNAIRNELEGYLFFFSLSLFFDGARLCLVMRVAVIRRVRGIKVSGVFTNDARELQPLARASRYYYAVPLISAETRRPINSGAVRNACVSPFHRALPSLTRKLRTGLLRNFFKGRRRRRRDIPGRPRIYNPGSCTVTLRG